MDQASLLPALLTTIGTLFLVELADKDALFLLALATRVRPSVVFAAGSIAFTISTSIILLVGTALLSIVPVSVIKLAGGAIMLTYAVWEFRRFSREQRELAEREEKVLKREGRGAWSIFVTALLSLIALDLAGDATELVEVVLLARFEDLLVVFSGSVIGLVGATAVETALGNRLAKVLSPRRVRFLSIAIFLIIGSVVVITTILGI